MSGKDTSGLSRRERQIMDVLYRRGRATANDVLDDLPGASSSSTVRTQLRVLEAKGHVRHEEHGLRYVYFPTTSRHAARRSALKHLVETFFDGIHRESRCGPARRRSPPYFRRRAGSHPGSGQTGPERRPMTLLIDWIVRPSVVLALAFAMIALLRSRAAALRHCILAAAILVGGISGPLSAIVPEWTITVPQRSDAPQTLAVRTAAISTMASTGERPRPTAAFDMTTPLVALWLCGIVLCLARIAVSLIGLRRVAARADVVEEPRWHAALADVSARLGVARPIRLLESGADDLATWGTACRTCLFRSRLVLERCVDTRASLPRARTRPPRRLAAQRRDRRRPGRALVQSLVLVCRPAPAARKRTRV